MRRLACIAVLCLAAGCGRDFSLPKAPAGGPRFLGPLAGAYDVRLALTSQSVVGTQTHAYPVGRTLVLQDLKQDDGQADPIIGLLRDDTATLTLDGTSAGDRAIRGSFQAQTLTAVRGVPGAGSAKLSGTVIPGGGGLVLDYATCPGETLPPIQVRAQRTCTFEPQLSGVFVGHGGSCTDPSSGGAQSFALGLRVLLPGPNAVAIAVGMDYPDVAGAYGGAYEPFTGCGAMRRTDLDTGAQSYSVFKLKSDGTTLTLSLERGTEATVPPADLCAAKLGTCTSAFVGTRQVGTAPDPGCSVTPSLGLSATWQVAHVGLKRYLDVEVRDRDRGVLAATSHLYPGVADDRSLLDATLEAADGSGAATKAPLTTTPGPVSVRFQLPDRANDPGAWRLSVTLDLTVGPSTFVAEAAMPACVLTSSP